MIARSVLLAGIMALALTSGAAAREACLRYGEANSVLMGKVYGIDAYGPPGFGETPEKDARRTFLGLTILELVCVKGRGLHDRNVGMVELEGADGMIPPEMLGQDVQITGRLVHVADETGERLPALMRVTKVQPVK